MGAEIVPLPLAGRVAGVTSPGRAHADARGETRAGCMELFGAGEMVMEGLAAGGEGELTLRLEISPSHGLWSIVDAGARRLMESACRGMRVRGRTAAVVRRRVQTLGALSGLGRVAVFFQIFAEIAAAPEREVQAVVPQSPDGLVRREEMVRAVAYIRANYRDAIGLPELLRLTHMSRASFARQFRRQMGRTFSTFLNQVRLEAVCHDLRGTSQPVGTIAFAHGFNQLSFFNRLFRREMGQSPSCYRARLRADEFTSRRQNALAS